MLQDVEGKKDELFSDATETVMAQLDGITQAIQESLGKAVEDVLNILRVNFSLFWETAGFPDKHTLALRKLLYEAVKIEEEKLKSVFATLPRAPALSFLGTMRWKEKIRQRILRNLGKK